MRPNVLASLGLAAGLSLGCGSTDTDPPADFGQHALASLDEPCEGVPGLTGQAVLDQRFDRVEATLGYVTAGGVRVSPTTLALDLAWPAAPVAVCYPERTSGGMVYGPRVAIEGLTMRFVTADGKFDETLPAKAWRTTQSGVASVTLVVAAAPRGALRGAWAPFPDYDNGGGTLTFVNRLAGSSSGALSAGGAVGLNGTPLAEVGAGIIWPGNAMATWPLP